MRTKALPFVFLGLVVILIGCSKNSGAPARISGKITYNGQPIKAGDLKFHAADGGAYGGLISNDGTYAATDLPEGEMIVTVETEAYNPQAKGGAKPGKDEEKRMKMAGSREPPPGMGGSPKTENAYIKIPSKYSNPKTSPISIKLTSGRQVKDIELTD